MGIFYDLTVPEGYVFAMGDNRAESKDCRAFGCVPVSKVESKVAMRFWPFSKWGKVNQMKNIQIEELLKNVVEKQRVVRRIYIFRNSGKLKTINMQKNLLK